MTYAQPLGDSSAQTTTVRPPRLWDEPGRVRLRTLVLLRWLAISGQTGALIFVQFGLGFDLPLGWALAAVAVSAWVNLVLMTALPSQRLVKEWEAALQLGFDVIQLAVLLALTGGVANPFMLLFIAPVAVSASALRPAVTGCLTVLAAACVAALWIWHGPLPWIAGETFDLPPTYKAGVAVAVLIGLAFTSVYAWRVAAEEERLNQALLAAQDVLAREQKLSALGGLAAAAAHELGTPLATIHLVAREMAQGLPAESPLAEDVALLVSQAERCREILRQLARRGAERDAMHDRLSLAALLEEVSDPHRGLGREIEVSIGPMPGYEEAPAPELVRAPEILHGLGNFLENAIGFAERRVRILASWSATELEIAIADDGPGFPPGVLQRLGEPYVSERGPAESSGGLGLGFFIAKTLLERTGGAVEASNRSGPQRGALVVCRWPRRAIEAAPSEPEPKGAAKGWPQEDDDNGTD